jgi:hypothetical protein
MMPLQLFTTPKSNQHRISLRLLGIQLTVVQLRQLLGSACPFHGGMCFAQVGSVGISCKGNVLYSMCYSGHTFWISAKCESKQQSYVESWDKKLLFVDEYELPNYCWTTGVVTTPHHKRQKSIMFVSLHRPGTSIQDCQSWIFGDVQ